MTFTISSQVTLASMSEYKFEVRTFPPLIARLGFQMAVPVDWEMPEIPRDDIDLDDPTQFFPLMLAAAPEGDIALTVAVRPVYSDGTLEDWAGYLLDVNSLEPVALVAGMVGLLTGIVGIARQGGEGPELTSRFAYFADQGRLVSINLIAPSEVAGSLEPVWKAVVESFALTEEEEGAEQQKQSFEAGAEDEAGFQAYALADDAASLNPAQPLYENLRHRGIGLTPNVLKVDAAGGKATVGAGAIGSLIDVPLGWYCIDDGKRTLLLHPAGETQIHLNLMAAEERSAEALLEEIREQAEKDYGNPEFVTLEHDGISALGIRNIEVDGEAVEQIHMLAPSLHSGNYLRARVTCTPEVVNDAADLAQLMMLSVRTEI